MKKPLNDTQTRLVEAIVHDRVQAIKHLDFLLAQLKNKHSRKYKQLAAERFALLPKSYQEKEQNS